MATKVIFNRVVQDAKEFGSTEMRAVSRVFFGLEAGGVTHADLYVDLEEPALGDHSDETLTVGTPRSAAPAGTPGTAFDPASLDREAFERAVRSYYRGLVTSAGYGKHLAKGKGFRTFGDTLGLVQVVEL